MKHTPVAMARHSRPRSLRTLLVARNALMQRTRASACRASPNAIAVTRPNPRIRQVRRIVAAPQAVDPVVVQPSSGQNSHNVCAKRTSISQRSCESL